MASSDPRSWLDRAMAGALSVLAIAFVLFIAVKLIEAIFAVLLVILGVGLAIAAGVAILRARYRRW